MAVALKRLEYDLREQIHEVRDEWHTTCHVSQCLDLVMDNYIEKVIDLTEEIDETREKLGEPIEVEY
ncbi:MAG: hypothetical protein ACYC56_12020 [Candidatus Aquicultor sp.]